MSIIELLECPIEGLKKEDATGVLLVMDSEHGDVPIGWNRNKAEEVEVARNSYEKLKKQGYAAYRTRAGGERGEVIREFDPAAERIVLVPPVVGG